MSSFLLRDNDIVPKKELPSSLWLYLLRIPERLAWLDGVYRDLQGVGLSNHRDIARGDLERLPMPTTRGLLSTIAPD